MHAPLVLALARIGDMTVAIPAAQIEQTLRGPLEVTPFPRARRHVPGAFAFRGRAVPVLDLAALLRPAFGPDLTPVSYAMVLRTGPARFAIALDALGGVVLAPPERLTPVATCGNGPIDPFFNRLYTPDDGGPVAVVLDLEAALNAEGLLAALAEDDAPTSVLASNTALVAPQFVFRLGDELYALPTHLIGELMVRPASLESEWPHPVLRGFHRSRAGLTPVLDLAALLGVTGNSGGVLLHIESDGRRAALAIDAAVRIDTPAADLVGPGGDTRFASAWTDTQGAVVRMLSVEIVHAALHLIDASAAADTQSTATSDALAATPHLFFKTAGALLAAPLDTLEVVAPAPADFGAAARQRSDTFIDHLSIKGRAVAIHDLARLLGRTPTGGGGTVLVARHGGGTTGFLVDRVEFARTAPARPLPGARPTATRFDRMVSAEHEGVRLNATVLDLDRLAAETAVSATTAA